MDITIKGDGYDTVDGLHESTAVGLWQTYYQTLQIIAKFGCGSHDGEFGGRESLRCGDVADGVDAARIRGCCVGRNGFAFGVAPPGSDVVHDDTSGCSVGGIAVAAEVGRVGAVVGSGAPVVGSCGRIEAGEFESVYAQYTAHVSRQQAHGELAIRAGDSRVDVPCAIQQTANQHVDGTAGVADNDVDGDGLSRHGAGGGTVRSVDVSLATMAGAGFANGARSNGVCGDDALHSDTQLRGFGHGERGSRIAGGRHGKFVGDGQRMTQTPGPNAARNRAWRAAKKEKDRQKKNVDAALEKSWNARRVAENELAAAKAKRDIAFVLDGDAAKVKLEAMKSLNTRRRIENENAVARGVVAGSLFSARSVADMRESQRLRDVRKMEDDRVRIAKSCVTLASTSASSESQISPSSSVSMIEYNRTLKRSKDMEGQLEQLKQILNTSFDGDLVKDRCLRVIEGACSGDDDVTGHTINSRGCIEVEEECLGGYIGTDGRFHFGENYDMW